MLRLANLAAAALMLCSAIFLETFFTWPQVDFLRLLIAVPSLVAWPVAAALALGPSPSPFVVWLAMVLHGVMMIGVAPFTVIMGLGAIASGRPGFGVALVAVGLGIGALVLANHREFVRRGLWRSPIAS